MGPWSIVEAMVLRIRTEVTDAMSTTAPVVSPRSSSCGIEVRSVPQLFVFFRMEPVPFLGVRLAAMIMRWWIRLVSSSNKRGIRRRPSRNVSRGTAPAVLVRMMRDILVRTGRRRSWIIRFSAMKWKMSESNEKSYLELKIKEKFTWAFHAFRDAIQSVVMWLESCWTQMTNWFG